MLQAAVGDGGAGEGEDLLDVVGGGAADAAAAALAETVGVDFFSRGSAGAGRGDRSGEAGSALLAKGVVFGGFGGAGGALHAVVSFDGCGWFSPPWPGEGGAPGLWRFR